MIPYPFHASAWTTIPGDIREATCSQNQSILQIKCLLSAWDLEHLIELCRGVPDSGKVLQAFLIGKEDISVAAQMDIMS